MFGNCAMVYLVSILKRFCIGLLGILCGGGGGGGGGSGKLTGKRENITEKGFYIYICIQHCFPKKGGCRGCYT
jgi:hypothetical protein